MLKTRVLTALVLLLVLSYFLFVGNQTEWKLLVLFASFVAAWEWAGFAEISGKHNKALFSGLVLVSCVVFLPFISTGLIFILTTILALVMGASVVRFQQTEGRHLFSSKVAILSLGLLSIVLFSTALVYFREVFSIWLLLLSMAAVWAMDTGAYFSGRKFGKKKLAVHVSPGKTWEGVWGGVVVSFVLSLVGLFLLAPEIEVSYFVVALVMSLIAAYSVIGDLFESLLKRQAGMKDSGSIFPGHGGILDRVDSLIIAFPMYLLLWIWVVF